VKLRFKSLSFKISDYAEGPVTYWTFQFSPMQPKWSLSFSSRSFQNRGWVAIIKVDTVVFICHSQFLSLRMYAHCRRYRSFKADVLNRHPWLPNVKLKYILIREGEQVKVQSPLHILNFKVPGFKNGSEISFVWTPQDDPLVITLFPIESYQLLTRATPIDWRKDW